MAKPSAQALFPRKERQSSKRRGRGLPWQTFLSLEPLEHRLMLDGMVGGNHPDRPDPIPAYVGSLQPSNPQNLKADEVQTGLSPAGNAATPSTQNAGVAGATKADAPKVETTNLRSEIDPATNVQLSGEKPEASNPSIASMPAVNADAATVHFAQLGNDATSPSKASIEISYPEAGKQGGDLAKSALSGPSLSARSDNGVGEAIEALHAASPQTTPSNRLTTQSLGDRTVVPEPAGGQSAYVQTAETQPRGATPSITDPAADGMRSSDAPINEIASVDLQTSKPLAVGEEVVLNHGLQQEAASARSAQPVSTAAISARSLTPRSGFVDMIFASIGQDTAKGLKSFSQEPADPWILRGVVIQPADPAPQGKGSSRSKTSP